MGRLRTASDIWHPPIRSLRGLSRGMLRLYGLVEAEVADNLINLDDDVLGDLGLNGFAIYHLDKGDALVIGLCDRYLTKYLEFVGNDDAD